LLVCFALAGCGTAGPRTMPTRGERDETRAGRVTVDAVEFLNARVGWLAGRRTVASARRTSGCPCSILHAPV
jgi:hypothetical protein